jgi:hypothetical protein
VVTGVSTDQTAVQTPNGNFVNINVRPMTVFTDDNDGGGGDDGRGAKKRNTGVPSHIIHNHADEEDFDGGDCEFKPEDKNPWIQDRFEGEDDALIEFMGTPQPQSECFGCSHLSPLASQQKPHAAIERSRLDQLNINLNAALGLPGLNQTCLNLAREYEENIRVPANKLIKPGQKPLLPWNAATIKLHLTSHTKNPIYRMLNVLEELGQVRERAHKAAPEIHPVKKARNGKPMERVNPEQWKIMKEAIELEQKLLFSNLGAMTSNWNDLRTYTQKNGSDFIDVSQKNVYYHIAENQHRKSGTVLGSAGGKKL